MCRKIKNFLFHPVFSPLSLSLYEDKQIKFVFYFLFVKIPLYVLIYEEQITFALKESGLIQEQRKNEKRKEKLHEQNNLNGKTD